MPKLILTILLFATGVLTAQDITGKWAGELSLPQGKLPLIVNIAKNGAAYNATMDSPVQGVKDIPVNSITFANNELHMIITAAGFDYKAKFENGIFKGTLNQNGNTLPLDMKRESGPGTPKKPQEPVKPYPYYTEDVTFTNNAAGIKLAGTLTLPKKEGNFPAVILITGSGPQNRDEEILGHKPFLVLADHLTRNGIAVLRFDDRGIAKSEGDFQKAVTQDFVTDTEAAFRYLQTRKEINTKKIGLAGHSEGGTVAAMAAAKNPDVAFVVLMAGGNIPGDELMLLQNYLLGKAQGMPEEDLTQLGLINRKLYAAIKTGNNPQDIKKELYAVFNADFKPLFISKGIPEAQVKSIIDSQVEGLISPWYIEFIRNNPTPSLEKIKCPILALNGEKDLQVAPTANLDAVKRAAEKSGNKNVTVKALPGLNHLFQESVTGMPQEYESIEQTFSPVALNEISSWIGKQVK